MRRVRAVQDPNDHLRTDEVRGELRQRTVRSGAVSLSSRVALGGVGVVSAMILARLLTPRDFGLLAMASTLTTFVSTFRDFGLPMATVYRENIDHRQVSTLFWANLSLSALIALGMALLAPVLAWFYGDQRLTILTLVVTASTFVGSLGVQHEAILQRQMRFGALTAIEIVAAVAGLVVGVTLALLGAGYWSLVGQMVIAHATRSAALWLVCRWRPARLGREWHRVDDDVRSLFSYGVHHAGSRVLSHVGRKLDQVLVGRFAGASVLGLYSSAMRWSQFPFRMIYTPLVGVAVAALSRVQNEPAAYRAHARLALQAVFAASLPVLAFLFVEARLVIPLLLGPQWIPAVPLFQVLCVAAFVVCVSRVTKWLYLSQGATPRELRWAAISTPIMILAVAFGSQWGAMGVAVAYAAAEIVLAYPSIAYCLATSHLRKRDFFGAVARPAMSAVVAAAVLFIVDARAPSVAHPFVAVLLRAALFWTTAALVFVGMPGGVGAARALFSLLRELRPGRRPPGHAPDESAPVTPAALPGQP